MLSSMRSNFPHGGSRDAKTQEEDFLGAERFRPAHKIFDKLKRLTGVRNMKYGMTYHLSNFDNLD